MAARHTIEEIFMNEMSIAAKPRRIGAREPARNGKTRRPRDRRASWQRQNPPAQASG
jgi:hypothetical protein